jgi:hypothetical protein
MSKELYVPRAETLADRVCQYFRRLPDEELSVKDIAVKWQADPKNVSNQLILAVAAELLKVDGSVYSAGPEIGRLASAPSTNNPFGAPGRASPKRAPVIDIEAIEFEDDVPLTVGKNGGEKVKDVWARKLLTMKPGQSFRISKEHRHSLQSAITALRKSGHTHFATRTVNAELMRVWCTEKPTEGAA